MTTTRIALLSGLFFGTLLWGSSSAKAEPVVKCNYRKISSQVPYHERTAKQKLRQKSYASAVAQYDWVLSLCKYHTGAQGTTPCHELCRPAVSRARRKIAGVLPVSVLRSEPA